jgi:hypothetical protein
MRKLRYLSAQPATDYYVWQVEVLINNFIEMGINPNDIDIVCYKVNGIIPKNWSKLADNYAARFFFYDDTRINKNYISSIRPNILKQHFKNHRYLEHDAIFYHDCDIIFSKSPNWDRFLEDDIWYGSDTRFYISHSYINGKGHNILEKMCEIVGINPKLVEDNEMNCIGAQYIMKNIDYLFWENVENDCENLFKQITDLNNEIKKNNQDYHELQIWCADMWALLWNGWKKGVQTLCDDYFKFTWATERDVDFHNNLIFHNAGIVDNKNGLFFKGDYHNTIPYKVDLKIKDGTASKIYWDYIQEVGNKSVII